MNLLLALAVCLVLLALGLLLGRYYAPDRRPLIRAAEEGRTYARGLVEVLEGDEDRAIDEITSALKRNTDTIEAYFALGTLFRRRGEHERAVRVHQAVLMRRDLDKHTRLRVHHQLALDFRAAGFPRRAIQALERIVGQDRRQVEALRELARLYEETGDWERAAAAHLKVGKLSGEDTSRLVAHMLAEQAASALQAQDLSAARRPLKRALSAAPGSIHALHVLAAYQQRRGDLAAAAKVWEKCLRLEPSLASYFAPRLEVALFDLGQLDRLDALLRELLDARPGHVHLRLAYARLDARRNPERGLAELTAILDEAPTLLPARREAARLVLASGDPAQIRKAFEDLVGLLQKADKGYRCQACGHTEEDLFWRCRACGAWDSVGVAWGRRQGEATLPTAAAGAEARA